MQQLLSSLEDERQRQFRRFVGISAAAHVALAILFWIGPIRVTDRSLPVVERVQLVEALAAAPVARPAPARPAPVKPPPPPPPPAKKILPKQPAPLPTVKPAPPKPKPKEPEPVAEESYEELMDRLRMEKIREAADDPIPKPVEQAALPAGPTGGPGIVDPELARWHREVKIDVTPAWIVSPEFRAQALIAHVIVDLSPTGVVLGTSIKQSSGNPWFDESVERAIEKASPLPAPPDSGEWTILFDSQDMQ